MSNISCAIIIRTSRIGIDGSLYRLFFYRQDSFGLKWSSIIRGKYITHKKENTHTHTHTRSTSWNECIILWTPTDNYGGWTSRIKSKRTKKWEIAITEHFGRGSRHVVTHHPTPLSLFWLGSFSLCRRWVHALLHLTSAVVGFPLFFVQIFGVNTTKSSVRIFYNVKLK